MSQDTRPNELTRAEVEHVAVLARLALTEEEIAHLRTDLTSVLFQVQILSEVDTEHIEPSASILPLSNVMADDDPIPSLTVEQVLANVRSSRDGQIRVPPIFEEQS